MSVRVGDTVPPFRIDKVSAEAMKRLAVILRDPNPIHLDPLAVSAIGLGDRVINQGPANLAYLINALQAAFPGGEIASLDVAFTANVFGGDTVEAGGRIVAVTPASDADLVTCEMTLEVTGRTPALKGVAVIKVPRSSGRA